MREQRSVRKKSVLRHAAALVVFAVVSALIFLIFRPGAGSEPITGEELPMVLMDQMFGCDDHTAWSLDMFESFFKGLPVWLFLFLFGSWVYEDWTIDQAYQICRCRSRTARYLRRCFRLLLFAGAASVIYTAELFLFLEPSFAAIPWTVLAESLCRVFLSVCSVCFFFALLQSLISLLYGASIGFIGASAVWCASFVWVPLFLYWNRPNSAWQGFVGAYTHAMMGVSGRLSLWMLLLTSLVHDLVFLILGLVLVRRCDVGLTDKEAI